MKRDVGLQLEFLVLVCNISIAVCMDSSLAKPLLTYDYQSEKFILNDLAVGEIEALQGPLRIISVVGDAYVGRVLSKCNSLVKILLPNLGLLTSSY